MIFKNRVAGTTGGAVTHTQRAAMLLDCYNFSEGVVGVVSMTCGVQLQNPLISRLIVLQCIHIGAFIRMHLTSGVSIIEKYINS